jgi:two-component system, OmpR family, copper resistance phosphate regulon response regulator CusR
MAQMRILIVEDAKPMAAALAKGLREQGYGVDVAFEGAVALQQAEINRYDAIVLDVMLPGCSGLAVCQVLRAQGNNVPILMLTARDAIEDRVAGLDAGADDYLTKPFAFRELLARLRALLRRQGDPRPPQFRIADLVLDTASQEVTRGGRVIRLTAKEYALLEYLLMHAGEVVSRERISENVWDESFDPFSNLIEVYIQRLRKKIDEGEAIRLIHTRRGSGYLLRSNDEEESSS